MHDNCFPTTTDDELQAMFPPPEPDRATLGGLVKATRRAQGMTQKELAKHCGVSFAYISGLENNRLDTAPSTSFLARLAFVLYLPLEELTERLPDAK